MESLQVLKNSIISGHGKDEAGIHFLEFATDAAKYRGYILRDEEGNGPGFLFGLFVPASSSNEDDFYNKYYSSAIGAKVVDVHLADPRDWEDFPHLKIEVSNGSKAVNLEVEISCDPEGNAPGVLAIEPII